MNLKTMTAASLRPAEAPTLYFIGVTTGSSSIQDVFPLWAEQLGLADARLQGIDLPLHAPREEYRAVVEFIKNDPLSLGALVTTHKIDLYNATVDIFDEIDAFATMMGETSCLSKNAGGLVCHAKDPISSGLALDAFIPDGYWESTGAEAFSIGAGGSTIAITWYLSQLAKGGDRPSTIIVSNRSAARLDHLREIHEGLMSECSFEYVLSPQAENNDEILARLAPGSLVINATGLGKDAPGSPLSPLAQFPENGIVWDLNYRGDLVFLEQARQQKNHVTLVEDGWIYFLHGWTQVIGEVFHIEIPTSGASFAELSRLAQSTR